MIHRFLEAIYVNVDLRRSHFFSLITLITLHFQVAIPTLLFVTITIEYNILFLAVDDSFNSIIIDLYNSTASLLSLLLELLHFFLFALNLYQFFLHFLYFFTQQLNLKLAIGTTGTFKIFPLVRHD